MKNGKTIWKRLLGVLLALVMVLLPMPAHGAAEDVILIITGYRVLAPEDRTMPFYAGTTLYVPVRMFVTMNISFTEVEGGFVLGNLKRNQMLYFDQTEGVAYWANGEYRVVPIQRDGELFVPFFFTAERLELFHTYREMAPAPFVWIAQNDEMIIPEEVFLRTYPNRASALLAAYEGQPHEPPVGGEKDYCAYPVVLGTENGEALLQYAREAGIRLTFALDPTQPDWDPALLREIAVGGHSVVFTADRTTTREQLTQANRVLFQSAWLSTRTLVCTQSSRELPDAQIEDFIRWGYSYWDMGYVVEEFSLEDLERVYAYLEYSATGAIIGMADGLALTLLENIRGYMAEGRPTYRAITDLQIPTNDRYDLR